MILWNSEGWHYLSLLPKCCFTIPLCFPVYLTCLGDRLYEKKKPYKVSVRTIMKCFGVYLIQLQIQLVEYWYALLLILWYVGVNVTVTSRIFIVLKEIGLLVLVFSCFTFMRFNNLNLGTESLWELWVHLCELGEDEEIYVNVSQKRAGQEIKTGESKEEVCRW